MPLTRFNPRSPASYVQSGSCLFRPSLSTNNDRPTLIHYSNRSLTLSLSFWAGKAKKRTQNPLFGLPLYARLDTIRLALGLDPILPFSIFFTGRRMESRSLCVHLPMFFFLPSRALNAKITTTSRNAIRERVPEVLHSTTAPFH